MPDLGLEVLLKGKNLIRLFGGLWAAVRINLITRMIKTTSLCLMIGVVEVIKVAQQIIEANRMSSPNAAFGVYLTENYPDITLQKYDTYANAKNALENGNGVAWANDNTEVIAFALQNEGYTVGIATLGDQDTIAPAVSLGNSTLLDWLNEEIEALGEEEFFHADYEATLLDTYGADYEEELVIEGGVVE